MQLLSLGTVFELNGVHTAIRMEFNQIGLAIQIEPVAPYRQSTLHSHTRLDFIPRRINKMMHNLPTRCVYVILKHLLQMNQPALARIAASVPSLNGS